MGFKKIILLYSFLFLIVGILFAGERESKFMQNKNALKKMLQEDNDRILSIFSDQLITFGKVLEEGTSFDNSLAFYLVNLRKRIADANDFYSRSLSKWQDDEPNDMSYVDAAFNILSHVELIELKLLTLGNVINILGLPDQIKQDVYDCQENGRWPYSSRMGVIYFRQKVEIQFSSTGFVIHIVEYNAGSSLRKGVSVENWPDKYIYAESTPIITGVFSNTTLQNELLMEACALKSKLITFKEWKSVVSEGAAVPKEKQPLLSSEVKSKIMLIDGITDRCARVYYQIETTGSIFYFDSWWFYDDQSWKFKKSKNVTDWPWKQGAIINY